MEIPPQLEKRGGAPMKKSALVSGVFLVIVLFSPPNANAGNGALCDSVFHFVYVRGAVNLDGSETGFEYLCQTGSPNGPLLVYVQGGGGCWTGDNCDCQPN